MKKKKLALKFKKTLSLALAASMLCSLAACGSAGTKSNDQDDFRMTTEENTRIDEILIDQPEPQHVIADEVEITEDPAATTTEEPAPSANGQYTYTVYGDVELSMDVNVDDWIGENSKGETVFFFSRLAEDLGWEPQDPDGDGSNDFLIYATNSGPVIKIDTDSGEELADGFNATQIDFCSYEFTTGAPDYKPYYTEDQLDMPDEHKGAGIYFDKHYSNLQYIIAGTTAGLGSRDDIILLAYLLWEPTIYDGSSFFYEYFDKYRTTNSVVSDYRLL